MPKYGYLVVEGPHDVEFIYRLLSPSGFDRVRLEKDLDPFFQPLVPRKFPPDGDLQRRMPVPLFLQSESHAVAVHSAVGDSRLIETLEENATVLDFNQVSGIGIILDSDDRRSPGDRYKAIKKGVAAKGFALPNRPGEVTPPPRRMGAFVLPDNTNQGTLEDLLLECGEQAYPDLLNSARTHVETALNDKSLKKDDTKDLLKPAGRNKAIIGTIASVLPPGKAIQVSIQDNRWLKGGNLKLARIKAIRQFLANILEI